MKNLKDLKKRWNASTPTFFKKLIHVGIVIGLVGGALITLPATASVGAVLVTIGTTAATVSKFAKI
jgi:hypothetical protein